MTAVDAPSGHERIVNAAATLTRLGGSIMAPSVVAAMVDAATRYVDLPAEYERVGARVAALTGNPAAAVTAGAAAGLTLTVASVVTGPAPTDLRVFPRIPDELPDRVVMLAPQRNGYDYAVEMLGATIVEIEARPDALRRALAHERTACVLWFAGTQYPAPGLTIEEVVAIAHESGVAVIVDAAAQVPSRSSFTDFTTGAGADAVVFSGGKGIGGPQTTGFVLGRADIVEGVRAHASPHHGVGRGFKVGKEELAAALAAIELVVSHDEAALLDGYERVVRFWLDGLADLVGPGDGAPLRSAVRSFPSEAGQPHGRAQLTTGDGGPTGAELADRLWTGEPRVAVLVTGESSIALNPQPLAAGEEGVVLEAVRRALVART